MLLKIIFGQRKQDYSGQYVPEALAVIDEYCYGDNREWLYSKLEEYRLDKSFSSVEIINVKIDGTMLDTILNATPQLAGKIQK